MKIIHSDKAPKAIGPYSQAIAVGDFLFCSGQIPLVPETMEIIAGDVEVQTQRVIQNLSAVLEAHGFSLQNIVKTTVFIKDMNEFPKINGVYEKCLARIALPVRRLKLQGYHVT